MRHITPKTIRPPFARYSYGVEIPPGHRILICSGQLGIDPADRVPGTVEEQTQLCFRNIEAVLKDAGLRLADVVRINAFVTGREHLKGYMAARDQFVSDPPPASTLMIVSGFSRPEFLVEVEVIAASARMNAMCWPSGAQPGGVWTTSINFLGVPPRNGTRQRIPVGSRVEAWT